MRNVTLTCPVCGVADRAVGDPAEKRGGAAGRWYCFACKSEGSYAIEFTTIRKREASQ